MAQLDEKTETTLAGKEKQENHRLPLKNRETGVS